VHFPPFCPNSICQNHLDPQSSDWFLPAGFHHTKAFGPVPRFRCRSCGKSFSTQTFSIDYYAKRHVDYQDLLTRHANAESVRGMSRAFGLSCGTILNRIERLSRQAVAVHAGLRPEARNLEKVSADGFVSFDVSQYFPSEIAISITAASRFVLDFSHATRKRSGTMTEAQRKRAAEIYPKVAFEHGAISRGFQELLTSLHDEPRFWMPKFLLLITDEKKEYVGALERSALFKEQDEEHRVVHERVSSKLPRTYQNPLFPSNYLDREIRKDQANHHRETTCFNRNVANGMARLACYLVHHNYRKRFLIKARGGDERVHGEVAGIDRGRIDEALAAMFARRYFLSRIKLPATLAKIWKKAFMTPLKLRPEYLPKYAFD